MQPLHVAAFYEIVMMMTIIYSYCLLKIGLILYKIKHFFPCIL